MRATAILTLLLINAVVPACALAQDRPVAVTAGPDGAAQITFSSGRAVTIPKEEGQAGIGDARIAPDGTVGWLVMVRVESVSYPVPETLVIWRAGRVIRRFQTAQVFGSWTFYAQGKQVAYDYGPLHGTLTSRCEVRDLASGRLIAVWDGDLRSGNGRPAWTDGLSH